MRRRRSSGTNPKRQREGDGQRPEPARSCPAAAAPRPSLTLRVGTGRGPARPGASLMVAIVLLAVSAALVAEAARTAVLHRRGSAATERAAAADLFAGAAARLARARAAADPSYPGEDWTAETPLGPAAATIAPDDGGGFAVDVELTDGGEAARARRAVGGASSFNLPAARTPLTAPKPRPAAGDANDE